MLSLQASIQISKYTLARERRLVWIGMIWYSSITTPHLYKQGVSHKLLVLGGHLQQYFHVLRVQIFPSKLTPRKRHELSWYRNVSKKKWFVGLLVWSCSKPLITNYFQLPTLKTKMCKNTKHWGGRNTCLMHHLLWRSHPDYSSGP